MTVVDFITLARRGWRLLLIAVLLGTLAGVAYYFVAPKTYEARATGFIAAGESLTSGSDEATARATSYVTLISSGPVREAIAKKSDGKTLEGSLSARVVPGAPLIEVTATSASPADAVALASGALDGLAAVIAEIEAAAGTEESSVSVVPLDDAVEPTSPASPNLRVALIVGFAAGLVVGLAVLLLRRVLDVRVRSNTDLAAVADAGLLGRVPKLKEKDGGISVLAHESFRHIRTGLRFASVDGEVRVIVVTSANQSEGKSFVASSLARAFAEAGQQTIIIDGDLRRPTVATRFDVDGTIGLSEVLSGQVTLNDAVHTLEEPHLFVLASGGIPPNPSEMLGSEALGSLVRGLREQFIVIIDAPPLLPVTDAALLSAVADGVVLVAAVARTRKAELTAARANLTTAHARVLGVVLNMVALSDAEGAYSYYRQNRSYYLRETSRGQVPAQQASTKRDADGPARDDDALTRSARRRGH